MGKTRDGGRLRGLTLIQPWAYAVTHLGKMVENRVSWRPAMARTTVPDVFALHAGLKLDDGARREILYDLDRGRFHASVEARAGLAPEKLARGAVVAVCTIETVITSLAEAMKLSAFSPAFSYWYMGKVGIVLRAVEVLETPVPCQGMLGFWALPDAVAANVIGQLDETSTAAIAIKDMESRANRQRSIPS